MVRSDLWRELCAVSARLGADRAIVQGAGGNVSLKEDGTLWVKASGCWLADAEANDIMVPLALEAVRHRLADAAGQALDGARLDDSATQNLKPSIETALHAVLPHPVVLHVHSLNATTLSILADGPERLKACEGGWRGAFIPYVRPGPELAAMIAHAVASGGDRPNVFVLQNHGLVVAAESPAAAADLLHEVERDLAFPLEAPTAAPAAQPSSVPGYRWDEALSRVAMDRRLASIMCGGALAPDQVVFLGGPAAHLPSNGQFQTVLSEYRSLYGGAPAVLLAPDRGGYVRNDLRAGADDIVAWVIDMLLRVPTDASVVFLPDAEARALAGWEAEKYRLAQSSARAGQ